MIKEYQMTKLTAGQITKLVGKTDFAALEALIAASNGSSSAETATLSAAIANTAPAKHLSATVDNITS